MCRFIFYVIILLVFSATQIYAGGGGVDEYATEIQVRNEAKKAVASIIEKGKIDASWANIEPAEAKEQMGRRGLYEWTVTFINPDIADKEKQVLYVILNTTGQVPRANFSGK